MAKTRKIRCIVKDYRNCSISILSPPFYDIFTNRFRTSGNRFLRLTLKGFYAELAVTGVSILFGNFERSSG